MKLAFIYVTETGKKNSECLRKQFEQEQKEVPKCYAYEKGIAKTLWDDVDGIVFFCATGIAVRAISDCLEHKSKDPAVIVIDEAMRFSISLVSGHLGGANELALNIAKMIQAIPVITTASDAKGLFSPDEFAKKNHLVITDFEATKKVAASLVNQKPVGMTIDSGIYIGENQKSPYKNTCWLRPRNYVLGIGCKKDTKKQDLENFVFEELKKHNLSKEQISKIVSIDRKANEPAIIALAEELEVPFQVYQAKELMELEGEFTSSAFVESVVGVDNVCERSVVCAGAKLFVPKTAKNGMTLAIGREEISIVL